MAIKAAYLLYSTWQYGARFLVNKRINMKNKSVLIATIVCFTQFSLSFGVRKPEEQKSYWQVFQEFKNWASEKAQTAYKKVSENAPSIKKVYENAPSAGKTAIATAGAGIVLGGVRPQIAVIHSAGGYMITQGVKQAWDAILNGSIGSSLAAGPLLSAGLGMAVLPTVSALSKFTTAPSPLDYAGIAIIAIGLGTTAAGLISAIYHNVTAPIVSGEIARTEVVDESLKNMTRDLVKAAVSDDVAYPTRSAKLHALLKRDEFLNGDDTDIVVAQACSDLSKTIEQEFSKKSEDDRNKQKKHEKEIDNAVTVLKQEMAKVSMETSEQQIEFLIRKIKEFKPQERAVISLLTRTRNKLAIDLAKQARGGSNATK